ncbi:MAG: GPR endopeptidase [Oscillospiraceae bacterium]|nr:GPR endopeptidase [Oscillospiraceae bacterium]
MKFEKRTDLALEATELRRSAACAHKVEGIRTSERNDFGYRADVVEIDSAAAANELGKPEGTYVTLDLRPYWERAEDALERAARAVGAELRALMGDSRARSALVIGLGNRAMTPDAIGPQAAEHVLVTRHLADDPEFAAFAEVSVLVPGVLGRTGIEALELIRGAARSVRPDAVIVIDALASRSTERVCASVQLSDAGIVPGSGVGNSRSTIDRASLGIPVFCVGVPTVVDARTLALDLLERSGAKASEDALHGVDPGLTVTPRDIDAQIRELSRIVGYGVDLALQPIDYPTLCALMG